VRGDGDDDLEETGPLLLPVAALQTSSDHAGSGTLSVL
jgi:hypothetical protein